jgi:hypothetical protein
MSTHKEETPTKHISPSLKICHFAILESTGASLHEINDVY